MDSSDPRIVAANAAQGFQVFQCEECAQNIKNALVAAGHRGEMVELRGSAGRDFIVCRSYDGGQATIYYSGRHLGVRLGNVVFDNLHSNGMDFEKWLKDFDAIGGVEVHSVIDF